VGISCGFWPIFAMPVGSFSRGSGFSEFLHGLESRNPAQIERGTRTLRTPAGRYSLQRSAKRAHYSLDSRPCSSQGQALRGNGGRGARPQPPKCAGTASFAQVHDWTGKKLFAASKSRGRLPRHRPARLARNGISRTFGPENLPGRAEGPRVSSRQPGQCRGRIGPSSRGRRRRRP